MSGNERKLYITKGWVFTIFFYYCILLCLGLAVSVEVLINRIDSIDVFRTALLGSVSVAISASSIAYIRKLYKLCFIFSSDQDDEDQLALKRIGTVVYFVTRPLFSVIFSILLVVGFKSGLIASTKNSSLSNGFVYLSMFFSFYVGFLSGEFIKKLEKSGKQHIKRLAV